LLQNIEKLESYVKTLEKKVQKQAVAAKKAAEADAIDDTAAEAMYASLAGSAQPALTDSSKELLPPKLREAMHVAVSASPQSIDWGKSVSILIENNEAARLSTGELNSILLSMPVRARQSAGKRLLTAVACKRDALSYDLMMHAHASLGQATDALATFDSLRQAGLNPTQYSYAHLMKAFAETSDVTRAAALYKHMQDQGLEVNLVTSTTLISCCIRAGHIDRAFSIFDALKYRAFSTAPDIHTYSLMIHACAKDPQQSAERASELFQELTERGLKPARATFNALIHVYATRRDYFAEAWKIAELMKANEVDLDQATWHALLAACAMSKDLMRARKLVQELEAIGKQQPRWAPNERTFQHLFRAYASATNAKRSKVRIDNSTLETSDNTGSLIPESFEIQWINQVPFTSNDVLEESRRVMAYIQKLHPEHVSTQLVDTYMTIAITFSASKRFMQDWDTLYATLQRSRFSFEIALQAAYAFRNSAFLDQVWSQRDTWISASPRNEDHEREATRLYIEALARCERLAEATETLAHARTLHRFTKRDLHCFQTKAVQLEDEEAVVLYNSMFPASSRNYLRPARF
jgi:pentatricopeptide repeat protein